MRKLFLYEIALDHELTLGPRRRNSAISPLTARQYKLPSGISVLEMPPAFILAAPLVPIRHRARIAECSSVLQHHRRHNQLFRQCPKTHGSFGFSHVIDFNDADSTLCTSHLRALVVLSLQLTRFG